MKTPPRQALNRHIVILVPQEPAFEWFRRLRSFPPHLTLHDMQREPEVFLVRENQFEDFADVNKWVNRSWPMLFDHYLNRFPVDPAELPQNRTWKLFKEWFEVRFQPVVWDLAVTEPLVRADHED